MTSNQGPHNDPEPRAKECPHKDSCEMYAMLHLAGSLQYWQYRFCDAEYERCARYEVARTGRPVPIDLLPNGDSIDKA